jgi:hypothetical protein
VVLSHVFECVLPWAFYSPFREHRLVAVLTTIGLMFQISLSGNYNFFNLLTALVVGISLDDEFILRWTPEWVFRLMDIKRPVGSLAKGLRRQI